MNDSSRVMKRKFSIKAELSYNPYTIETDILFNGKKPHINSLIEKYQGQRLNDWIEKIPDIFRDEMNGFDFELDFTGTDLDFEELCHSFLAKGVSEAFVDCVHLQNIEDRETKLREISAILNWLEEHRNRTFDWEKFRSAYTELLHGDYPIFLIHGEGLDIDHYQLQRAQIERVDDLMEIENISLSDVPLIYFIDELHLASLQEELKHLLRRSDVETKQLFFIISQNIPEKKIKRVIYDIGVENPVILSDNDNLLKRYCLLYPITDYINDVVKKFNLITHELKQKENIKREENEKSSKEIYDHIDGCDERISRLKEAQEQLSHARLNETPASWTDVIGKLFTSITDWKSRKIKTTNDKEAIAAADDFNDQLNTFYDAFVSELRNVAIEYLEDERKQLTSIYLKGSENLGFHFKTVIPELNETHQQFEIANALKEMKTSDYVQKEDIFGKLFKLQETEENKSVLENTYSYQDWRDYVTDLVKPMVNSLVDLWMSEINDYLLKINQEYQESLSDLLNECQLQKDRFSSQLGDEEKKFQDDVNWLATLEDQLNKVKRG